MPCSPAEIRHPIFARAYARFSPCAEHRGSGAHRQQCLEGLSGRVVEVGCGNGLNFTHYPSAVREVTAVEPEAYLRRVAEQAPKSEGLHVTVVDGQAERLPFDDDSFDGAVVSLVLCSVRDVACSLQEVLRVLRPGGQLAFYEHVRSESPLHARLQEVMAPLWRRVGGGCNPDRDTALAIAAAGFQIEALSRFQFCPGPRVPLGLVSPHILGRASKPLGN